MAAMTILEIVMIECYVLYSRPPISCYSAFLSSAFRSAKSETENKNRDAESPHNIADILRRAHLRAGSGKNE